MNFLGFMLAWGAMCVALAGIAAGSAGNKRLVNQLLPLNWLLIVLNVANLARLYFTR